MLNFIWPFFMITSVIIAFFTGKIPDIILAATESAKFAFTLALGLTGIMILWLGIMKIAETAGLIALLTRVLKPILAWLFPDVPADHPAMGSMTMNIAANIMGLHNAATPFGLRAMVELEKLNPLPGTATNSMCTFLALHSSNMQLVPTTAIALLALTGAHHPADIIVPFILSSFCGVITAIIISKILEKFSYRRTSITIKEETIA